MRSFVKKLAGMLVVLVGVVLLLFIMLRIIPGSPVTTLLGEHVSQSVIDRMTEEMGLNDPLPVQFFRYVGNALRGDFGTSYKLNRPVTTLILDAFPNTIRLSIFAALFAWGVGIIAGIISAICKNQQRFRLLSSLIDRLFMGGALVGVSMPVFMTRLFLQYFLAYRVKIFPLSGFDQPLSVVLPAIALGWNSAGTVARMTRSSLLEVMQADYISTARAKGRSNAGIILHHALKNSMLPVVTMMALQISSMLSGAVITETVFGINGIGRLAVTAIQSRDMPLLQGTVIFTTILVMLGNLAADTLYSVLDPRIRREG